MIGQNKVRDKDKYAMIKFFKLIKQQVQSKHLVIALLSITSVVFTACKVSYKFNGASIDYNKVHTIQIADFPIRSAYVWGNRDRKSTRLNSSHSD